MNFAEACHRTAYGLRRQALVTAAGVALALAALFAIVAPADRMHPDLAVVIIVMAGMLAAFAALALSALLYFDAVLFTWMASYPDEISGGAAVDEFLAGAKLKSRQPVTRPLSERIAGAFRLRKMQRLTIAVFAVASLLAIVVKFA